MDFGYFRKGGAFRNDEKQNLKRISLKPKFPHAFTKKNYFLKTIFSLIIYYKDLKQIRKVSFFQL